MHDPVFAGRQEALDRLMAIWEAKRSGAEAASQSAHFATGEVAILLLATAHELGRETETLRVEIAALNQRLMVDIYRAWRATLPVCPPHEHGCRAEATGIPLVGCDACEWTNEAPL